MSFFNKATKEAKSLNKAVWIAAVILPGGFTAIGLWVASKSVYQSLKDRKNK